MLCSNVPNVLCYYYCCCYSSSTSCSVFDNSNDDDVETPPPMRRGRPLLETTTPSTDIIGDWSGWVKKAEILVASGGVKVKVSVVGLRDETHQCMLLHKSHFLSLICILSDITIYILYDMIYNIRASLDPKIYTLDYSAAPNCFFSYWDHLPRKTASCISFYLSYQVD